jgi:hypothetical protein
MIELLSQRGLSEFRSSGVEERDFSLKFHATISAGP